MSELFADKLKDMADKTGRYQKALDKVKEMAIHRAMEGHFDLDINWQELDKELFDSINTASKLLKDLESEGFKYNDWAFTQQFGRLSTPIFWGENNE
ncbi:MAG: hypothetical protein [Caudoviricetes sp.]|nr:MAG: hypothetical protein [Caudoviricetes sp.]